MIELPELILSAAQMSRDAFMSRYPNAVFLARGSDGPSESDWHFRTQTVSSATVNVAKLLAERGVSLTKDVASCRVYPLAKALNNPWRERISIGRARNNDIVLLDTSVSKLHAHVTMDPKGINTVQDAASRNGTIVNGKRLQEGERVDLARNDKVVFGRVDLVYLDRDGLYDFLVNQLQRSRQA